MAQNNDIQLNNFASQTLPLRQGKYPEEGWGYENNILTLKNVTILGEFNASGNTSGAGVYAVGQLKQPVSLTIELLGNNTVSGFSGIAVAANHSSGKDASLTIRGSGSLIAEGAGVVDGGIAIRASNGAASLTIENVSVKASAEHPEQAFFWSRQTMAARSLR